MVKSPRAALTRLATTIASRYYSTSGANSGFYLDGRISGRREQQAADVTLDREDRGFFISVFASLSGNQSADAAQSRIRKALDRIMSDVKQPGRNIDAEINELAECAVHVAGRITLQHEGVSQPYFAGIVVRDSELAAVTMGSGCAYLYRGDVIYPLTSDDYPLDAVDTQGKPVSGMDVYCAGVAGTVRYSNIAQLQLDDCVIVCNKEIMEALGQREILRLLYEAEDQADAAGMIITEATAKIPGIPMQIMIGFVESITSADRTGRISYSRTQADGLHHSAPLALAGTQSHHKSQEPAGIPKADHPVPAAASTAHAASHEDPDRAYDDEYEDEDFSETFDSGGRGRKTAFYLIIAAVCIASLFAIYNMLFASTDDPAATTTTATADQTTAGETSTEATDTAETTDAEESTGPTDPETDEEPTEEPTTTTETTETAPPETTTQTATTAAPTDPVTLPTEYTVAAGDSLYSLANRFYGSPDQDYIDLLVEANDIPDEGTITIGDVLTIPARP